MKLTILGIYCLDYGNLNSSTASQNSAPPTTGSFTKLVAVLRSAPHTRGLYSRRLPALV